MYAHVHRHMQMSVFTQVYTHGYTHMHNIHAAIHTSPNDGCRLFLKIFVTNLAAILFLYGGPPSLAGDTAQGPQWVSERTDGTLVPV